MRTAGPGYETRDANPRPLLAFAVGLALLSLGAALVTSLLEARFQAQVDARSESHPLQSLRPAPEGPLLQADTTGDLAEQRRWEDRVLTTYDWVDRPAGIVRVPIEEAMRRYVEEHGDG